MSGNTKTAGMGTILLFLLLLAAASAAAQEVTQITFNLIDESGVPISDALIRIEISDVSGTTSQDKYTSDGSIGVRVFEGRYEFTFLAKSRGSEIYSRYGSLALDTRVSQGTEQVVLEPVSYLRVRVLDQFENLIPRADVSLDCPGSDASGNYRTDGFGTLSVNYVRKTSCTIHASSGRNVGSASVNMTEPRLYEVDVVLDRQRSISSLWVVIPLVLLIGAASVFLVKRRPSQRKEQKAENGTSPNADGNFEQRIRLMMKALEPVDRQVIEALLQEKGMATQSRIRNLTRIPKSSLFRSVSRLEQKGIVRTESFGKMKRVYLQGHS